MSLPSRQRTSRRPRRPTWQQLVEREPRLQELFDQARSCGHDGIAPPDFCIWDIWEDMRGRLFDLVGDSRPDDPVLGTWDAYDVAFSIIYQAFPECTAGCGCRIMDAGMRAHWRRQARRALRNVSGVAPTK